MWLALKWFKLEYNNQHTICKNKTIHWMPTARSESLLHLLISSSTLDTIRRNLAQNRAYNIPYSIAIKMTHSFKLSNHKQTKGAFPWYNKQKILCEYSYNCVPILIMRAIFLVRSETYLQVVFFKFAFFIYKIMIIKNLTGQYLNIIIFWREFPDV